MTSPASNYRPWLVLFAFLVIGLCLYSPSLSTPFIFDDDRTVSMNPNVMHLWPADWLTKETRPAGSLTFALNYQFHGLSLRGYHLTNTAIHVLAAWVLFLLLSLVLKLPDRDTLSPAKAEGMALAAAVLWLVHPLNTQAVSYIAQRYESQMGLCFLLTLYCVARGALARKVVGTLPVPSAAEQPSIYSDLLAVNGTRSVPTTLWYASAIAAGWFGMLSKEVMASVLLVAPLFDRAFLAASWKDVAKQRGWVYAAIVPALVIVLIMQRSILVPTTTAGASAGFALQGTTPWEYFRTQPEIILHYLGLACLPRQLIFDYDWPVQNNLVRAGISGLILTAIFIGSVMIYIRRPRWGLAAISFFLILGPTSSIMPIADLAVEHRMYLPLIVVCLAAVFLGNAWLEKLVASDNRRQQLALAVALIAVSLLSIRTYLRNEDYRQPIRIYAQNVKFNPLNRRAHNNLATELRARGLNEEARKHFEIAVKLAPQHPHAYYQLGLLSAEEQDFAKALEYFTQSLELGPNDRAAEYCRGLCFMELRNDREAVAAFERVLKMDPTHAVSKREIAWVLATSEDESLRDGKRSLEMAEALLPSRPTDPRLMEVLAAAHAATGEYDQATELAEKALASAERARWNDLKRAALVSALGGYREQKPLRRVSLMQTTDES